MENHEIATIMGFESVDAMMKYSKKIKRELQEASQLAAAVSALNTFAASGATRFFTFAGRDMLCDANYQVSLAVGLDNRGFIRASLLSGNYHESPFERDRNPNYVAVTFPPKTSLQYDVDNIFFQCEITNKETGDCVKFTNPHLTNGGWMEDIQVIFKLPNENIPTVHVETIILQPKTMGFWPTFLDAVVR